MHRFFLPTPCRRGVCPVQILFRPLPYKCAQFLQRHPAGGLEKEGRVRLNEVGEHFFGFFLVGAGPDVRHVAVERGFCEPAGALSDCHEDVDRQLGCVLAHLAVELLGKGLKFEHVAHHGHWGFAL